MPVSTMQVPQQQTVLQKREHDLSTEIIDTKPTLLVVMMGAAMGTGVGLAIGFIGGSVQILRWVSSLRILMRSSGRDLLP